MYVYLFHYHSSAMMYGCMNVSLPPLATSQTLSKARETADPQRIKNGDQDKNDLSVTFKAVVFFELNLVHAHS